MKKVIVEVLQDASHPDGGYGVILLRGIDDLPDAATFRLKPVDARGNQTSREAALDVWPAGDLSPLSVRAGDRGIELLIGPDIVESPALVPGTLGVIEIKSAGIRGEFLWPSIRPTARPRRRNLTIVGAAAARSTQSLTTRIASASSGREDGAQALTALQEFTPAASLRSSHHAALAADEALLGAGLRHVEDVGITALDHDITATASNAEAVGGNIVPFNPVHDALAAERGTRPHAGPDGVEILQERRRAPWLGTSRRITALASMAAILFSGSYLLFGKKAEQAPRLAAAPEASAPSEPTANTETVSTPASSSMRLASADAAGPARSTDAEPSGSVSPEDLAQTASREASAEPSGQVVEKPAEPAKSGRQVVLRMRGGGFQISGELKAFDGAKYVIETSAAGVLTMDAARFDCEGVTCARPAAAILPLSERPSPSRPDVYRIEGAPALTRDFVPQLIRDYAASIGAVVTDLPRAGASGDARRYRISDPRGVELATIEVAATATSEGLAALERGTAVLALADRPAAGEAGTKPSAALRGRATPRARPAPAAQPTEIAIGQDGIAVVVAPSSPVGSLPLDLLAKVVAGQITDWFELGQAPGAISLHLPPDASGTMETFTRQVMRPRGLDVSRSARRLPTEAEAAEAVARDPRGLAVVSFAAMRHARPLSLETACGLLVRPTAFAVKAGEYPLVRNLSLHLPREIQQPSARGIVRIAQSSELAAAVTAAGIVDPTIASLPMGEQSERMAWAANAPAAAFDAGELRQFLNDLAGASRLSTTFRFVPGTNDLDAQSRREVVRLASALKEPDYAGRRILLAGFTDQAGKLQANMTASARRAAQVRTALLTAAGGALDPRHVESKGYGPLAPVACAGAAEGTRLNRRVEVWIAGKGVSQAPQQGGRSGAR